MKIPAFIAVCLCVLVTGCASNPGVVAIGANSYLLTRSSAAGAFANMAALRGKVLQEANDFAASKGMVAIPINAVENRPAVGFPSFEYQFRLVTPAEATRIAAAGGSKELVITRNDDPEGHAAQAQALAAQAQALAELANRQNQPRYEASYPVRTGHDAEPLALPPSNGMGMMQQPQVLANPVPPVEATRPPPLASVSAGPKAAEMVMRPAAGPMTPNPSFPSEAQLRMSSSPTGRTQMGSDGKTWYEYSRTDGSRYWSNESPNR